MRRYLLVLLMVCLPLQWGWANAHVAADAAHTASHSHTSDELTAIMLAPIGNVTHSVEHSHSHDADHGNDHGSSKAHEHHSHYITVLGLGVEPVALPEFDAPHGVSLAPVSRLDATVFSRIERPKWFTRA